MNLLLIILFAPQRSMGHYETETALSWLVAKINLTSASHQPPPIWITQLLESLDQRFAENDMMIVHLKLRLNSIDSVFKASVAQAGQSIRGTSAIARTSRIKQG